MPAVPGPRQALRSRPRIGVVKFASCDGCQLTLLDLEDDLLAIADRVDIVEFAEATSTRSSGPFDILFVEGSVSTPEQAEEIVRLRAATTTLVTIGACATAGGIQAIRNPDTSSRSRRRPRSRTTSPLTPSCADARSRPSNSASSSRRSSPDVERICQTRPSARNANAGAWSASRSPAASPVSGRSPAVGAARCAPPSAAAATGASGRRRQPTDPGSPRGSVGTALRPTSPGPSRSSMPGRRRSAA